MSVLLLLPYNYDDQYEATRQAGRHDEATRSIRNLKKKNDRGQPSRALPTDRPSASPPPPLCSFFAVASFHRYSRWWSWGGLSWATDLRRCVLIATAAFGLSSAARSFFPVPDWTTVRRTLYGHSIAIAPRTPHSTPHHDPPCYADALWHEVVPDDTATGRALPWWYRLLVLDRRLHGQEDQGRWRG